MKILRFLEICGKIFFTEYLKAGFIPGKNLFYYRDQNGVEIDFIIEIEDGVHLIEAKYSENPKAEKLNFLKVAPLFKTKVNSLVACNIPKGNRSA